MKPNGKMNTGFTLLEILVTMALSGIVIAGTYAAYLYQQRSHVSQQQIQDMHQNVRNTLYVLENELRMAGYDPEESGKPGFVEPFPAAHASIGPKAETSYIAFTVDDNESGAIEESTTEIVAYRLQSNTIERYTIDPVTAAVSWETVAENIDVLNFVYLDDNDPPNVLPAPVANPEEIYSVQITLVARTGKEVPVMMFKSTDNTTYWNRQGDVILAAPNDLFRRMRSSVEVQCRNLGLQK